MSSYARHVQCPIDINEGHRLVVEKYSVLDSGSKDEKDSHLCDRAIHANGCMDIELQCCTSEGVSMQDHSFLFNHAFFDALAVNMNAGKEPVQ